jgi:hypothetical protein
MAVYAWKRGSHVSIDPQSAGERLEQLKYLHGVLTADIVLEDAQDDDSPLHDGFEWDNTVAAERYRLEQARYLLRSVVVKDMEGYVDEEVRAFVVVKMDDANTYVSTQVALTDDEMRSKVLLQAHRDLDALERKYHELSELAEIFRNAKHDIKELVRI